LEYSSELPKGAGGGNSWKYVVDKGIPDSLAVMTATVLPPSLHPKIDDYIGAVDGTQITISPPHNEREPWRDRDGNLTQNVLVTHWGKHPEKLKGIIYKAIYL
jgi:hypothetical protein